MTNTNNNTVSMYETNYTMPENLDVLMTAKLDVDKAVENLNKALDEKKDVVTVKNLEESTKKALKELNGKIAEQWVKELSTLSVEESVKTYLNAAGELGAFRLKNPSGEIVHYEVASTKRSLSFPKFEKAVKCASSSVYDIMAGRFLHNISLNIASDTEGIGSNQLVCRMDNEQSKKAGSDFSGFSNKSLEKQLNALVKGMLPESMEVKMKLTDLRFIKGAMQKNIMGKGAGVELAKEKALYTAVISAIYVRMNDGKYTLTSSANIHKESKAK